MNKLNFGAPPKEGGPNYSIPRTLEGFRNYLKERSEKINGDFLNLAEWILNKRGITDSSLKENVKNEILEALNNLKNEIRKIIGENINYFTTTIHFRPRAIDFFKIGRRKN